LSFLCARGPSFPTLSPQADAGRLPLDHVAVVVQPLDAAEPVIRHNAAAALIRASVMKLVTSFAALNQLGPGYAWTTDIWADGTIADAC